MMSDNRSASSALPTDAVVVPRKRVLLTGASGYLGQHVLHQWMMQQDDENDDDDALWFDHPLVEIHALYSSLSGFDKLVEETVAASQARHRRRSNVQVVVEALDLTTTTASTMNDWIESHLPLDVCIHTAAISNPGVCEEQPERAHAVNVPKQFLQALADYGVPIVALSTDQVFDGTQNSATDSGALSLYTELDTPNPINQYGASKVALEEFLQTICPHAHVSLRSSIILGALAPFGKAHSTFLHFCSSRQDQETDFFTDECRTVVSIRNVVEILQYFAIHPPDATTSGIYHMGGRDRVSRYDMARSTFEHLGYDTKYLKPTIKAVLPPGNVKSPLDISMDSSKLAKLLKKESWHGLEEILLDTFPQATTDTE